MSPLNNIRSLLLLGVGLASFNTGAHSQSAPQPEATRPQRDKDYLIRGMAADQLSGLLQNRNREVLHPGQPLDIVGNEEGDNGFRHRTPMLEGAEVDPTRVDTTELRERRLAMYSGGASFSSPTTRESTWDPGASRAKSGKSLPGGTSEEDQGTQSSIGSFLLIVVAAGVATIAWRARS